MRAGGRGCVVSGEMQPADRFLKLWQGLGTLWGEDCKAVVDVRLLGVAQREDLVAGVPQRVLNGAGDPNGMGQG